MHDTWFQDDHTQIIPNRATAYMPRGDAPTHYAIRMSMFDQMAGAAGIHTTVEDFGKWLRNYDDATVGGRAAVDAMTTPSHLTGLNNDSLAMTGAETAYGLGLDIGTYRGLRVVTHTGSWGGYRTAFMRFPQQHFAVATFCNFTTSGPDSLAKKIASIYLARDLAADKDSAFRVGLAGEARSDVTAASLRSFVGVWRNVERGEVRRTELAGDTLVFASTTPEGRHTVLVPLGGSRFRQGTTTQVAFQDSTRLVIRTSSGLPISYTRVAAAAPHLPEYAGTYYTPEVDVAWVVRVDKGALVVTRGGRRVGTLLPTYRDGFVMGATEVDFTRDAKGKVSGFLIEAGRVRHLRFVRRD